jgi:hypothetical protein
MSTSDTLERERSPEQIEGEIAATRQSLDRKLHEIEKRLDPRRQWDAMRGTLRERLTSPPVAAWGAVAAVAAGSWMAVSGLRRHRMEPDGHELEPDLVVTEMTVCE